MTSKRKPTRNMHAVKLIVEIPTDQPSDTVTENSDKDIDIDMGDNSMH